jgi:hypothetical protein
MFRKRSNPLAKTPLCRDLSARELRAVAQLGTVVDFPKGRRFALAPYPLQVIIILTGAITSTAGGDERTFEAGRSLGITSPPNDLSPKTLETIADSTFLVLSQSEFATLRDACPRLAARLCDSSLPPPTGPATQENKTGVHDVSRDSGVFASVLKSRGATTPSRSV